MSATVPQQARAAPASRQRDASATARFALLAILACAVTTSIAFATTSTGDYTVHGSVGGDNAGPAIDALIHGNLGGYVAHQPAIGLVSLLVRAPFAALASLLGGGGLLTYRLGAAACLLSLGPFAAWLVLRRRPPGVGWIPGVAAAVLLLLSPAVRDAVQSGHPEDVLAGVLATVAVIAATRGHARWAAVILGLAIGSKPWAGIAVAPVLVAVPGERTRTLLIAGALTLALTAIAPLADPAAFVRSLHGEGATHLVNALSFWWPVSSPVHLASGVLVSTRALPFGMGRSAASLIGLAAALMLLALGWNYARHRGRACDALALLALLGVMRCAIDSTHLYYYYLVVLLPLVVWETVGLDRPPLVGALATVAVFLIPGTATHLAPAALSAASIAGTVLFGCCPALHVLGPVAADGHVLMRSASLTGWERWRAQSSSGCSRR